uniref:RRM domain-containing protein n=1 Tax=Paramoeba aestuarina TaxID=180227 RepID=A0A6U3E2W7_9EUKA
MFVVRLFVGSFVLSLVMYAYPGGEGAQDQTVVPPEALMYAYGQSYPVAPSSSSEPLPCTIYVGNIESQITEEGVRQFFSQFGPIVKLKLAGDPSYPARFAFIEFSNPQAATNATAFHGSLLGSRALKISMSKSVIGGNYTANKDAATFPAASSPSSSAVAPSYRAAGVPGEAAGDPYANAYLAVYGMAAGGAAPAAAAAQSRMGVNVEDASRMDLIARTVYVSGIDHEIEEEDLIHFFGMAGRVTACRIRGDTDHPSKFAFVEFSDLVGAQNSLQCTGCALGSGTIRVSRSKTAIQSTAPRMAFNKIKNEDKERILRTVYVGQVDLNLTEDQIKDFFSDCGAVTKVALAGDSAHTTRFAFVEFADLTAVKKALLKNDFPLGGQQIKVRPSKTPIYQGAESRKRARDDGEHTSLEDKRARTELFMQ